MTWSFMGRISASVLFPLPSLAAFYLGTPSSPDFALLAISLYGRLLARALPRKDKGPLGLGFRSPSPPYLA